MPKKNKQQSRFKRCDLCPNRVSFRFYIDLGDGVEGQFCNKCRVGARHRPDAFKKAFNARYNPQA